MSPIFFNVFIRTSNLSISWPVCFLCLGLQNLRHFALLFRVVFHPTEEEFWDHNKNGRKLFNPTAIRRFQYFEGLLDISA